MSRSRAGAVLCTMVCRVRLGTAALYVLTLAVLHTEAESGRKKDRDVSGLFPFPRVGRRDALESDFSDYVKKQGLRAFPRIGRGSGAINRGPERNDGSGVWIPRWGEAGIPDVENQWTPFQIQDPQTKGTSNFQKEPAEGRPENEASSLNSNDQQPSDSAVSW